MTSLILTYLLARIADVRRDPALHRDRAYSDDAGYTTETIAVIALLVVLALSVLGVVAAKVLAKANSIDLGAAP